MKPRNGLPAPLLAAQLGVDCSPSDVASIDRNALSRVAARIQERSEFSEFQRSQWDDPRFWNVKGSRADRSQYFAIGSAINFRFWSIADQGVEPAVGPLDGELLRGSLFMWRSLQRCLSQNRLPILDASFLADLTTEQFDQIFSDDSGGNPLAIAQEERIANLRDLGSQLQRDWSGRFLSVVDSAKGSLVDFVSLSGAFRAFDDPNFKLTMVNAILHTGSGIAEFDAEPLPGIDYHLLKQLLRQGVLRPRPDLLERIRRQELLDHGEAQELRRTALCAFIEICKITGLSGELLDNKWWANREKCRDSTPVCVNPLKATECPFWGACSQLVDLPFPLEETRYY